MSANIAERAEMGVELSITTLTGTPTYDLIGTLLHEASVIIFDNLGTVAVGVSNDGANTWKTFAAGEGLVLDLRSQQGKAQNFAFRKGMNFYAIGAAGACDLRISYIYPEVVS